MNCKRWDILVVDLAGNANDEMKTIGGIVKDWELVSVVSLPFCRRAYLKREAGKASEVKREIPDSTANPLDDAIARVQLGTKARAQHTDAPPAAPNTKPLAEPKIGWPPNLNDLAALQRKPGDDDSEHPTDYGGWD